MIKDREEALIRPFSNGSEYDDWLENNCRRCWKYNPELPVDHPDCKCDIENAICRATLTDGVPPDIWKRMGGGKGFAGGAGYCTELEETEPRFIDPNQTDAFGVQGKE